MPQSGGHRGRSFRLRSRTSGIRWHAASPVEEVNVAAAGSVADLSPTLQTAARCAEQSFLSGYKARDQRSALLPTGAASTGAPWRRYSVGWDSTRSRRRTCSRTSPAPGHRGRELRDSAPRGGSIDTERQQWAARRTARSPNGCARQLRPRPAVSLRNGPAMRSLARCARIAGAAQESLRNTRRGRVEAPRRR